MIFRWSEKSYRYNLETKIFALAKIFEIECSGDDYLLSPACRQAGRRNALLHPVTKLQIMNTVGELPTLAHKHYHRPWKISLLCSEWEQVEHFQ